MKITFSFTFFLLAICSSYAQNTDQNISSSVFWDTEPYLINSVNNPNTLVCAWMSTGQGLVTIKTKVSTDEGQTWGNTHTFAHHFANATSADVCMQYDNIGILYLSFIDYKTTFDSGAVYLYKSNDDGVSWNNGTKVFDLNDTPDGAIDRPWICIDRSNSSTEGNIYLTTKSPEAIVASTKHIWLKTSTDGGVTFSSPIQIDNITYPGAGDKTMATPCVDDAGKLYIIYLSYQTGSLQFPKLVCATSADQGNNYSYSEITTVTAYSDSSLQFDWDITSCQNIPVVVYTSPNSGDLDIMSQRLVNGNWSSPIKLNSDPLANGINQDMVWIKSKDPLSNTVAVVWRDRRNFIASLTAPFEIYSCLSTDGGISFLQDTKLSSGNSPFQMLVKGNDFLGVDLNSNYVFSAWGDYRNSNWEIYFNRIPISTLLQITPVELEDISISYQSNQIIIQNNSAYNQFELDDESGKRILTRSISIGESVIELGNKLATGIYVCTLSNGLKSYSQKLFIKSFQ